MVLCDSGIEVVIAGVAGYFPRSKNIDEFRNLLLENVHIQDPARWKAGQLDVCDLSSNVPDIDCFDASYFGVHRQQCTYMDPMQRIALERCFEAVVDAGLNPAEIRGKKIGVFMGSSISENDSLMFESVENGFGITGQARCMLANRISYFLHVTGPSCSFDSSWTNGTQVIQFALESIKSGQCDAAVVGTSNLALNIYPTWIYKQHGFTSNDGVTRAFDDNAEGYSRGESIVVLFLQRADIAKRNYASIIHTDIIFNGIRGGNFTHLEMDGFLDFLKEFYRTTGVDPKDVDYVETYGSGIKKLDTIELNAIEKFFCANRSTPLAIGAIKTNAGHSEAAAAMMSLIKVIISMECGTIPATLHYEKPNSRVPGLLNGKLDVVTSNRPWSGKYAAINSFGISSTIGHILLKINPKNKIQSEATLPLLQIVSTRTEEGIKNILKVLKSSETVDLEHTRLVHDVFSSNIPGHLYRGYVLQGEKQKEEFEHFAGSKNQVWFVYSGMGSQWCTMGKDLMQLPIFANAIEKCHAILKTKNLDLKYIISGSDPTLFDDILHSFVGIAAIQIGLTDIMHAIGIVPDGLIGHSVGELGCAYADGSLTAEQMILCAYYRGKASMDVSLIKGVMAAIGLGSQQIKKICPPTIDVACHNGPDSCTLSGPAEDMETFVSELQTNGVFAKLVNVSNIAYHSRYIRPAAPLLLKYLKDIIPNPVPRSKKWISTSIAESEWTSDLAKTTSVEYLTNNLLSSVYFEEGCKYIPPSSMVIEIAPHGLLQAILRRSLSAHCVNIPLTKRDNKQSIEFLLTALGKLYLSGLDIKLAPLYPDISLPVSRGTPSLAPLVRWEHDGKWRTGLEEFKDYSVTEKNYLVTMNSEEFRDLIGHQIDGRIVIPVAAYLMLVVDVLGTVKRVENAVFENIIIKKNVPVPQKGSVSITVMVQRGTGQFEVSEGKDIVASGRMEVPENIAKEMYKFAPIHSHDSGVKLDRGEFYEELRHRGYEFGGSFESISEFECFEQGSTAKVQWRNSWSAFITSMLQMQLIKAGECNQNLLMPVSIRRIAVSFEHQQTENIDLDVTYDISTGLISSDVIQIAGVHVDNFPLANKEIVVNNYKFVKFFQNNIQDLQTGLNIFLEIVLQNVKVGIEDMQITELKDNYSSSLADYVSFFFEHRCAVQVKISKIDNFNEATTLPCSTLMIVSGDLVKDAYVLLKQHAKYVLICAPENDFCLKHPISLVASFKHNGYTYHLLKKACNVPPTIIHINTESLSYTDFKNNKLSWVTNLNSAVKDLQNHKDKRIYLTSSVMPSEDLNNFIQEVKTLPDMNQVRFIFICDDNVPKCTPSAKDFQLVFLQDIFVSVLKNGRWGIYMSMIYPLQTSPIQNKYTQLTELFSKSNILPKLTVKYIGVEPRDFAPVDKRDGKEYVEYSGITDTGKRVMGIAKIDLDNMEIIPDPYLQWNIPNHWSLVDAASVPYAYSMAYHVLVTVTRIEACETILIHDGCSSFGQAAIAIAHSIGCTIYTTVGSDQQRAFLKARMTQLHDHHIMSYTDCSFETRFMAVTQGQGAHVILNCLSGDRLRATIRCLARLGRIIHFRVNEIDENEFIGLRIFLICTCMSGVTPRKIFDKSPDIKKKLYDLFADGLKENVVVPLERTIFEECAIDKIHSHLKNPTSKGTAVVPFPEFEKSTSLKIATGLSDYKCVKNASYVICGDNPEVWCNIAEWLIFHEAKQLHIITNSSKFINRRLSLIKQHHCAEIKLYENKRHSTKHMSELLRDISNNGPISTVFVLPASNDEKENMKDAYNFDIGLNLMKRRAHLVCLWGDVGGNRCYKSISDGLAVSNIRWESMRKFKDVLQILDKILESNGDILLRNDKMILQEKVITYKDFALLLPTSVATLKRLSDNIPNEIELVQVTTSCPRVAKEVCPVFLVPGLSGTHCSSFNHFILHLMYPAFCVNLNGAKLSIEEQAAIIIKKIQAVHSEGPYNFIGVSWGGGLCLEIAKQLEEAGFQTQLFFVDGVPDTIQAMMNLQTNHGNLEVNLLSELLTVKSAKDVSTLLSLKSWNARVKQALIMSDVPKDDHEAVKNAIELIKTQMDQIKNYQCAGKMINGPTKLFRPQNSSKDDSYGLTKYCKEVEIKIVTGNHVTMIQDTDLIEYINDNITIY